MRRGLDASGDEGEGSEAADRLARRWNLRDDAHGREERPDRIGHLALPHGMVERRRDRDAPVMCVIVRAMRGRRGHHDPRDDQAPDQLHAPSVAFCCEGRDVATLSHRGTRN